MTAIDVRSLLAEAVPTLQAAGIESARHDAEMLLAFCLGVERSRLLLVGEIAETTAANFRDAIARRATREPLQHVTGEAPFRHVLLHVGPGVFIPRPETELLVDAALPFLREIERPVVVDLCSGSGAIALAVAQEAPASVVYAVERSAEALTYLRRNAMSTGVLVVEGDIEDVTTLRALDSTVDVVLSNPPYVPTTIEVSPEVHHDPPEAVFGGTDGLQAVTTVIQAADRLLRPGGLLVMEHDDTTRVEVCQALVDAGWLDVSDHQDLTGRARYVTATKAATATS